MYFLNLYDIHINLSIIEEDCNFGSFWVIY